MSEVSHEWGVARTVLDLTRQEWEGYRPGLVSDEAERRGGDPAATEGMQEAWRVARRAGQILHERFGASRVAVFGSLASGMWFTRWSDIDLAAWGIPSDRFYAAVAAVTGLSPLFKVDLVDPEACRASVREALGRDGVEL